MFEPYQFHVTEGLPVYTLAECLGGEAPEMVAEIPDMLQHFRAVLLFCDAEELAFLHNAAALTAQRAPWDGQHGAEFMAFSVNRYAFLFREGEAYHLVLPQELLDIFEEVTAAAGFARQNERGVKLRYYADALVELYGIYDIAQFAAVWNQHQKDKIALDEAVPFLQDVMCFQAQFFVEDERILHDYFMELNNDEIDAFLARGQDIPYYMPTKRVLKTAHDKLYDRYKASPAQVN